MKQAFMGRIVFSPNLYVEAPTSKTSEGDHIPRQGLWKGD